MPEQPPSAAKAVMAREVPVGLKKAGRPLTRSCGFPRLAGATSGRLHASLLPGFFYSTVDLEAPLKKRGILFLGKLESVSESSQQQKRKLVTHGLEDQKRVSENFVAWLMARRLLSRIQGASASLLLLCL